MRRLVDAFDAVARMNGAGVNSGVRVGVMSSAAGSVHRLMKERPIEVCQAITVGGMMRVMVSSAVSEGSEEVSANVTPLIAVLAGDATAARGMMEDGTMQGMLTLAKAHHLNEQIVQGHNGDHRVDGAGPTAHRAHRRVGQRGGAHRLPPHPPQRPAETRRPH